MSYEIILRHIVRKELDLLSDQVYRRIAEIISILEQNPRPSGVKKLSGSGLWRVRVGNYRVVYSINDSAKQVMVVRIARSNEDTYKGL